MRWRTHSMSVPGTPVGTSSSNGAPLRSTSAPTAVEPAGPVGRQQARDALADELAARAAHEPGAAVVDLDHLEVDRLALLVAHSRTTLVASGPRRAPQPAAAR